LLSNRSQTLAGAAKYPYQQHNAPLLQPKFRLLHQRCLSTQISSASQRKPEITDDNADILPTVNNVLVALWDFFKALYRKPK
jgi:hypothetical protein